jgi:hypothetical protein
MTDIWVFAGLLSGIWIGDYGVDGMQAPHVPRFVLEIIAISHQPCAPFPHERRSQVVADVTPQQSGEIARLWLALYQPVHH